MKKKSCIFENWSDDAKINDWKHFQMLSTSFLVQAAKGKIDLNIWVEIELANRGLNPEGEYIGFKEALKLLNSKGVDNKIILR